MILYQKLTEHVAQKPSHGACVYLGKEIRFPELLTSTAKLSYLYQRELGPGARLAWVCRSSVSLISTFFAMTNIRGSVILFHPDSRPIELKQGLRDSKATHVAVTSDLIHRIREILRSDRLNLPLIEIEKKKGGEFDSTFTPSPEHVPQERDPILSFRSEDTAGKGHFLTFTHQQLQTAASQLGNRDPFASGRVHTQLGWYDPMGWVHGVIFPLLAGGTVVMDEGLKGLDYLNFLTEKRISKILGNPAYFQKLIMLCKDEKKTLPHLKSVSVGGGNLSSDLKKIFDLMKVDVQTLEGSADYLWL